MPLVGPPSPVPAVHEIEGEEEGGTSQELWDCLSDPPNIEELPDDGVDGARSTHTRGVSDDALDLDNNPFLDISNSANMHTVDGGGGAVAGPSRPRKPRADIARDGSLQPSRDIASRYSSVSSDNTSNDVEEARRVEQILSPEDDPIPEGPPATQATTGSSSTTSQRTSRTSFASSDSLQGNSSGVKLGKRRADDEPESHPPRTKSLRFSDEGPSHVTLRTSVSDPGPTHSMAKRAVAPVVDDAPPGVAIIAHNTEVQRWFDELRIPWGAQYEVARGVTDGRWSWSDVTRAKVGQLQGKNAEAAPRVAAAITGVSRTVDANELLLWEEMDREQAAILENKERGLGLGIDAADDPDHTWHNVKNWYGGQIQQIARLEQIKQPKGTPPKFRVVLGKLQMTRSTRAARYLGSRRVLCLKVPDNFDSDMADEREFLGKRLVLLGRMFCAFAVKDGKVYAMEINEDHDRRPVEADGDRHRISLEEFVNWHNPMYLNSNQALSKYAARFDLAFSNTVPVLQFVRERVEIIDDEYAPHDGLGKVPAHKIYTDGCGFMNAAALRIIQDALKLRDLPVAVQGRIFGSKGVWALHPEHQQLQDELPRIWIRNSQQKIQLVSAMCSAELDHISRAHFIFDAVAAARVGHNAHLSRHTVVNLHHNGVPAKTLVELMRRGLDVDMQPLMQVRGALATVALWPAVDDATGVSGARVQLLAAGKQRAMGLATRWEDDKDDGNDESEGDAAGAASVSASAGSSRACAGGKPISAGETVVKLLQSGFTLKESYLYGELQKVHSNVLEQVVQRMRLPLSGSAEAFMIPDPSGKLQEGQIHFRSSEPFEHPSNPFDCRSLIGECLIYRNPARLASDIQKVMAVEVPELAIYKDVIVVPNKGPCSLPSKLAGGDVDGDTAVCIWDPAVVEPFRNAALVQVPDGFMEENFEPEDDIVTVTAFMEKLQVCTEGSGPDSTTAVIQRHMLAGLVSSKVGLASHWHEITMYTYGYGDRITETMAHLFAVLLDSRKSGHVLKQSVYSSNQRRYGGKDTPLCMRDTPVADRDSNYPRRSSRLGKFILDTLVDEGKKLSEEQKAKFESETKDLALEHNKPDPDIEQCWKRYSDNKLLAEEVAAVKAFVENIYARWLDHWMGTPSRSKRYQSAAKNKEAMQKSMHFVRALAAEFNAGPPPGAAPNLHELELLPRVRACAAYRLGSSRSFAFAVAFDELCAIKAGACGLAPTTKTFDNAKRIPRSIARLLAPQAGTA